VNPTYVSNVGRFGPNCDGCFTVLRLTGVPQEALGISWRYKPGVW